jgi:predicted RNase H-like HicB family nuclease
MRYKYTVTLEKSENGFAAYVPDLPGCIALGETANETLKLIKEAIVFHLEGMRGGGTDPSTSSG